MLGCLPNSFVNKIKRTRFPKKIENNQINHNPSLPRTILCYVTKEGRDRREAKKKGSAIELLQKLKNKIFERRIFFFSIFFPINSNLAASRGLGNKKKWRGNSSLNKFFFFEKNSKNKGKKLKICCNCFYVREFLRTDFAASSAAVAAACSRRSLTQSLNMLMPP